MQQYPLYQIVLSFAIFLAVLGLIFGYPALRILALLKPPAPWKAAALWATAFFLAAVFTSFFLFAFGADHPVARLLYWIGFTGFGFFILLFTGVLLKDLLSAAVWAGVKTASLFTSPGPEADPGRRLFLSRSLGLGILFSAGGLAGIGILRANAGPRVVRVRIPLPHLPDSFDGFRIVQIVDLHVGPTLRAGFVSEVAGLVNGLSPDVVVLPGDLVDGRVGKMRDEIASLAGVTAPHGKFFTTGNHEYYAGVLEWLEEVKKLGFEVLVNEHRVIEKGGNRILLAGVTDCSEGRRVPGHASDPFQALKGAPDCPVKILLAHQPKSVFAGEKAGFDLQLSGHTHGGQLYPVPWLVRLAQPYLKGLNRHGRTWIYVSQGTGYWGPPMRIGTFPEITEITLAKAYV